MSRPIKKNSTNQSTVIRIIDSTDGTPEQSVEHDSGGIALWYRREGATLTAITEAALAALDSAHSDGGIEHIDDGYYRLDLPDAAVATGVNGVMIGGAVTGMIVIGTYHALVDYDPYDTVRMGMTALPNAAADAAGGLPISDAGELDLDAMNTNINDIETDTNELQTDDLPTLIAALPTAVEIQAEMEENGASILDSISDKLPTNYIMGSSVQTDKDDEVDAIKAKTDNLPADPADDSDIDSQLATIDGKVDALNDLSAPRVNAEMVDVMRTDTVAELAAVPAKDAALHAMIQFVFLWIRNKVLTTSSAHTLRNDADDADIAK